jgi:hypothetical protein
MFIIWECSPSTPLRGLNFGICQWKFWYFRQTLWQAQFIRCPICNSFPICKFSQDRLQHNQRTSKASYLKSAGYIVWSRHIPYAKRDYSQNLTLFMAIKSPFPTSKTLLTQAGSPNEHQIKIKLTTTIPLSQHYVKGDGPTFHHNSYTCNIYYIV